MEVNPVAIPVWRLGVVVLNARVEPNAGFGRTAGAVVVTSTDGALDADVDAGATVVLTAVPETMVGAAVALVVAVDDIGVLPAALFGTEFAAGVTVALADNVGEGLDTTFAVGVAVGTTVGDAAGVMALWVATADGDTIVTTAGAVGWMTVVPGCPGLLALFAWVGETVDVGFASEVAATVGIVVGAVTVAIVVALDVGCATVVGCGLFDAGLDGSGVAETGDAVGDELEDVVEGTAVDVAGDCG